MYTDFFFYLLDFFFLVKKIIGNQILILQIFSVSFCLSGNAFVLGQKAISRYNFHFHSPYLEIEWNLLSLCIINGR